MAQKYPKNRLTPPRFCRAHTHRNLTKKGAKFELQLQMGLQMGLQNSEKYPPRKHPIIAKNSTKTAKYRGVAYPLIVKILGKINA